MQRFHYIFSIPALILSLGYLTIASPTPVQPVLTRLDTSALKSRQNTTFIQDYPQNTTSTTASGPINEIIRIPDSRLSLSIGRITRLVPFRFLVDETLESAFAYASSQPPDQPINFSYIPGPNFQLYLVLLTNGGSRSFLWQDAVVAIEKGIAPWVKRKVIRNNDPAPLFEFDILETGANVIGVGEIRWGAPVKSLGRCAG